MRSDNRYWTDRRYIYICYISIYILLINTGLIVGGVDVEKASDFPHMAGLGYPDFNGGLSFKCGGSLISEFFVLTAAHCSTADRTRPSTVRLGDLNLKVRDVSSPEVDIPIERFIGHERYNKETRENDIAVVKLLTSVQFTKNIRPACLQSDNNLPKQTGIATGWGKQQNLMHFRTYKICSFKVTRKLAALLLISFKKFN